ncbi:LysR substrate-binding domain-containing protein [Catenovulum adriaticum]|uniref:LysR substrate-binding domain-containing protein n=1 Tax=Catenovulum adriaticum TaxID=2984846 RepID=A0ABY7ARX6_9ALTE|nr:LysR substrate-binding domain-containing protein [Catenovulum sp. TS8]WAJ72292.1 LysR substrate-binding domain-containing protein [Catenovulum sp. TS8]
MADISIKQLSVFCSVSETANLGQTAEALFMTRGAASQALKNLEDSLGAALFERHKQRLILNTHGQQLRPIALEMLARQQQLKSLFKTSSELNKVRIGASRTIGNYLLPQYLSGELAGCIQSKIELNNSQILQDMLQHYQLDIALIESERIQGGLIQHHWQSDQMKLICSTEHPLAGQHLNWSDLDQQAWIVRESASGSREQFDHHLRPHLNQCQIRFEMSNLDAIMQAVTKNAGIALVSGLACYSRLKNAELAQIYMPITINRQLSIVYAKANQNLPQIKQLITILNPNTSYTQAT